MDINGFYAPSGSVYYESPIAGEQQKDISTTLQGRLGVSGGGMLHFVAAANTTATVRYLQVWDGTPGTGRLMLPSIPLPANSLSAFPLPYAVPFSTSCVLAMSTTQTSYTAGGANDGQLYAIAK